jgi:hypothetical protein
MRRTTKYALVVAIPAEILIFGLFAYPLDDGFSPHDSVFYRLMSHLWLVLHWPALVTLGWLERRGASALSEILVFVTSGYIVTVLLIVLAALAVRGLVRLSQHQGAVHPHAH